MLTCRFLATKTTPPSKSRGMSTQVGLQLDYYMSAQFAGVASALVEDLYSNKGLSLQVLPICPVGEETTRVRHYYNHHNKKRVAIGSVEQNIFIPQLYRDSSLNLKAIAAMFYQSPLCLASLSSNNNNSSEPIGAHEDTVELLQRIVGPNQEVVASPRPTKNSDLANGTYSAIQAYTTTEVPALERMHGPDSVQIQVLEGWNGTKLGYSQMLFCPQEILEEPVDQREICRAFLEATFEGWARVIQDPDTAVLAVREARAMLGLDDENNDHWDLESPEYELEFVKRCSEYVQQTKLGNKYGVLDKERFNEASQWLLEPDTKQVTADFGLDTTSLWK